MNRKPLTCCCPQQQVGGGGFHFCLALQLFLENQNRLHIIFAEKISILHAHVNVPGKWSVDTYRVVSIPKIISSTQKITVSIAATFPEKDLKWTSHVISFKSGRRPVMPISHYFSRYFYGVTRDVNKAKVRCKWAVFDFFPIMPFGRSPTPPVPPPYWKTRRRWGRGCVLRIIRWPGSAKTLVFGRNSYPASFPGSLCL